MARAQGYIWGAYLQGLLSSVVIVKTGRVPETCTGGQGLTGKHRACLQHRGQAWKVICAHER